MGCINTKVAPIPENIRIRTKKERKMLKKALKKQGITAKVTKSGIAFEIPISGDFRRAKLPPIGKSMGKREHTHSSATDVMDTEIKREKAALQLERVRSARSRREHAEQLRKAAVERSIQSTKQEEAALRRADREKELMDKLHRRSLKRQTNKKLAHLLELFDMLQ
ncbi:uncharacterized protein LOC128168810 [Crassostrea angulata]|uniref:uncharacterized protein LOC128168810 n=1 Tax=Magallana angulata TaxID=2784310 RepID=UPI0022B0B03C|nr:uncharacterized protein LOC128168810 [Crassostrea angulata]